MENLAHIAMEIKNKLKSFWDFIYQVVDKFIEDKAPKFGAALSFYTVFSLAPILVIAVTVAGFIYGPEAARGEIYNQIDGLIGKEGALVVETALKNAQYSWSGVVSIVISLLTIIIGSTVVFVDIQDSLNLIWKVKPKPGFDIVKSILKDRLKSFAVVLVCGFLLVVSLVVSAIISAINKYVDGSLFKIPPYAIEGLNNLVTLIIIFILFMMLFKFLPDVHIKWRYVWFGALITSILFVAGKFLIGIYLGTSTLSSKYGAFGSLIILLIWIYYSAQILFLGAEFTYVYANKFGEGIKPKSKFNKFKTTQISQDNTQDNKNED